jgi:hypothetical protein
MDDFDAFDRLAHAVNSKCASLMDSVRLLQKASPDDRREMLMLMRQHARSLDQDIAEFETQGPGK